VQGLVGFGLAQVHAFIRHGFWCELFNDD